MRTVSTQWAVLAGGALHAWQSEKQLMWKAKTGDKIARRFL